VGFSQGFPQKLWKSCRKLVVKKQAGEGGVKLNKNEAASPGQYGERVMSRERKLTWVDRMGGIKD
jgi:hypothetical protein